MSDERNHHSHFPTAHQDARAAKLFVETPQTLSDSYKLAFQDKEFLLREELRPVRLQLELLKPEILLREHAIRSTIVLFGSARIPDPETAAERLTQATVAQQEAPNDPQAQRGLAEAKRDMANSRYYAEARRLARLISERCQNGHGDLTVVITGGGPGIMEAGNRGAHDVGAKSIGLNIVLPFEQAPNRFITPDLSFQFHYFALRKMHFLIRAKGLVAFPGGFGTLDELTDALTLIQTGKIAPMPVLLFGREYWQRVLSLETLVEEGMISPGDVDLVRYVDTAEEAWEVLAWAMGRDPVTGAQVEPTTEAG